MALPARKLEEQESEESIRQAWQMRLKSAINVLSREDSKPRAPFAPEVQPGDEAGMRAAWQGRSRVEPNQPPANIQPAPSLPDQPNQEKKGNPEQTGDESEKPDEERKENRFARALRKKLEAKRASRSQEYARLGASGSIEGKMKRYKQIKNLVRVIRAGSLAGTSLGDVFFSLGFLFLSLLGDWGLSKLIPGYQLFPKGDPFVIFDKATWYAGWAVIIGVIILIITFLAIVMYVKENPSEALKFFPALKNMIL